jgi:hypothetical protein
MVISRSSSSEISGIAWIFERILVAVISAALTNFGATLEICSAVEWKSVLAVFNSSSRWSGAPRFGVRSDTVSMSCDWRNRNIRLKNSHFEPYEQLF